MRDHIDLPYASTGVGAQGRTADAGLLYLDGTTDVRNLYVPMTRGTETNEAFIVITGQEQAVDVFARSIATDWIDFPAHTRRAQFQGVGRPGSTRPTARQRRCEMSRRRDRRPRHRCVTRTVI